jgi:hypothetical protein
LPRRKGTPKVSSGSAASSSDLAILFLLLTARKTKSKIIKEPQSSNL